MLDRLRWIGDLLEPKITISEWIIRREKSTYFAHLLITLDERVDDFDTQEIIVHRTLGIGIEDVGSNDGS